MRKVFLDCIYEKNLGDDLLIKAVCDRYKNTMFIIPSYFRDSNKNNIPNLKIININEYIYRLFRKICFQFNKMNIIDKKIIKYCDYVVTIGGSMFIEYKCQSKDYKLIWYKDLKKPYFILGVNIGPIYTDKYLLNLKESVFQKAKDVCVRDRNSYNMVKEMENVRCGSDIIFSYDVSKYTNHTHANKVIISVINCEHKKTQMNSVSVQKYEEIMLQLISFFESKNYEIELISFCKAEGDEEAIKEIINKSNKNDIRYYFYDGNIDEAISELNTASIIIGTRFHANVLGLLLDKVIIPVIYNDKTKNLLEDIHFKGKYIDMENLDQFDIKSLTDRDLMYKCNISKQLKDAQKHFQILDNVLERD